jgi:UDP-N-acetylmuramate dehydrogenase
MTPSPSQIRQIEAMIRGRTIRGADLRSRSTFRVGGPADILATPESMEELCELVSFVRNQGINHYFIGAGSNCLFMDEGFRGVIIRLTGLRDMRISDKGRDPVTIMASCGVMLPVLIRMTCKRGFSGLEGLWGIPGSLGGAVTMNAGAGEITMSRVLKRLTIMDSDGGEKILGSDQFHPGYREMALPSGSVVVKAEMEFERSDTDTLFRKMDQARAKRKGAQPRGRPSAGCVFKNPAADKPAGMLIERAGLKGFRIGDAMISPVHANFIVNIGNAASRDILNLITVIRERVHKEFGIALELEIKVVPAGDRTVEETAGMTMD